MSELSIHKVVIHELIKEQHKPIKPSNLRKKVLGSNSEIVIKLVLGITSLYGRRNNTAHYGTFREGEGRGNFPDKLIEYSNISTPQNKKFISLSEVAMEALYKKAEGQAAASGGYMLFVDYSNPHGRFFLVAMIKQKEGIKLSANLELEELIQLDLNRLHQAARISFGKLSGYLAAGLEARMDLSYLSFVSPSTSKTAAGYFVTALGCATGVAASRATGTLIRESYAFFDNNEQLKPYKKRFRSDLFTYLNNKQQSGTSAKLSEIEELARPYMTATETQTIDDKADAFISHLNSDEHAVPVEFPVNKPTLNKYTHISYKSDNWEIKIARRVISQDESAQICYDKENGRLIFNDIPDQIRDQIESELNAQTG